MSAVDPLAALCFGAFFVLLGEAGDSNGPAAVLAGRVGSVGVLAVLVAGWSTAGGRAARPDGVVIAALGALDVVANLAYASAASRRRFGARRLISAWR
jgi:hypothetical protein